MADASTQALIDECTSFLSKVNDLKDGKNKVGLFDFLNPFSVEDANFIINNLEKASQGEKTSIKKDSKKIREAYLKNFKIVSLPKHAFGPLNTYLGTLGSPFSTKESWAKTVLFRLVMKLLLMTRDVPVSLLEEVSTVFNDFAEKDVCTSIVDKVKTMGSSTPPATPTGASNATAQSAAKAGVDPGKAESRPIDVESETSGYTGPDERELDALVMSYIKTQLLRRKDILVKSPPYAVPAVDDGKLGEFIEAGRIENFKKPFDDNAVEEYNAAILNWGYVLNDDASAIVSLDEYKESFLEKLSENQAALAQLEEMRSKGKGPAASDSRKKEAMTDEEMVRVLMEDLKGDFTHVKLVEIKADEALKNIMEMAEPARMDIVQHSLILSPVVCNPAGVRSFIVDNELNLDDMKDVVYAIVICFLIQSDIVETTTADPYKEVPATVVSPLITDGRIKFTIPTTRSLMVAAVHAYAQGNAFETIKWWKSYCAVKGTYISQKRFETVIRLVITSPKFSTVAKMITLNELVTENAFLKFRLTRLSTPSLVLKAIELSLYNEILRGFDPAIIAKYRAFDEGGLLAQVAAGPLSQFCVGEIDPLTAKAWPEKATLADLRPIPEAPYDEKTIIRAKILLDIHKFDYGDWYQGNSAFKNVGHTDIAFRDRAKAIIGRAKEKVVAPEVEDVGEISFSEVDLNAKDAEMKAVIAGWVNVSH